jgi:hypothetical protein
MISPNKPFAARHNKMCSPLGVRFVSNNNNDEDGTINLSKYSCYLVLFYVVLFACESNITSLFNRAINSLFSIGF